MHTKDGEAHELDVLIMATGYDAHAYFRPLNMTNAQGMTLKNAWKDGPYALRTVAVPIAIRLRHDAKRLKEDHIVAGMCWVKLFAACGVCKPQNVGPPTVEVANEPNFRPALH